jgi:hypothetical protein
LQQELFGECGKLFEITPIVEICGVLASIDAGRYTDRLAPERFVPSDPAQRSWLRFILGQRSSKALKDSWPSRVLLVGAPGSHRRALPGCGRLLLTVTFDVLVVQTRAQTTITSAWKVLIHLEEMVTEFEPDALSRRCLRVRLLSWGTVAVLIAIAALLFTLGVNGVLSGHPFLPFLFVFTVLGAIIGASILASREALRLAEREMVFVLEDNGGVVFTCLSTAFFPPIAALELHSSGINKATVQQTRPSAASVSCSNPTGGRPTL